MHLLTNTYLVTCYTHTHTHIVTCIMQVPISYIDAAKDVIEKDGLGGLFVRGLETRILVNCIQGALFAVTWKYFEKALGV